MSQMYTYTVQDAAKMFTSLKSVCVHFGSLIVALLSPFCFKKPIRESVRQESSHTDGVGGIYGQFVGCGRVEASLSRSEASKPVFW